jgi:hypothetical protein
LRSSVALISCQTNADRSLIALRPLRPVVALGSPVALRGDAVGGLIA